MVTGEDVYIVSAVRTPVGAFQGALKTQSAVDLGTAAAQAAMARGHVAPEDIDEAYMGCVLQAGLGQAPARQVVLRAGCPVTTEATTVNKVCASGAKALALGAQSIRLGESRVVLVGGMESMSQAPYYMRRGSLVYGDVSAQDAVLRDGLTDGLHGQHMGQCAEHVAQAHHFSRQDQDDFAIMSYERAIAAWGTHAFDQEVVPITIPGKKGDTVVREDEEHRRFMPEKMRTLRPAFDTHGTVTAANASSLSDGASALILASGAEVQKRGWTPLARVLGTADAACAPQDFPTAPALAIPQALARAKVPLEEVALFEINEAFAVVPLANAKLLGLDLAKVNTLGGGVSLGHPIGSSGARIVVTLVHALRPGQIGVAGICNVRIYTCLTSGRWWRVSCGGAAYVDGSRVGETGQGAASVPGPDVLHMKKRSLAEAFQASLANDEASAPSALQRDSDEEDYMSDAMLAMLERRDAPRHQTYSERREQQRREEAARQRAEMQEAEMRRSHKAGRPLAGEWAARREGLATDRLAEAADRADRAQPLGAGTEAALRMMKAMGYVPGQALGAPSTDNALDAPLAPDQRWLSADGRRKKLGIGHADLSRRIAQAAEAPRSENPASQIEAFRQQQAEAAQQRHNEHLLQAARKTCRECDEAHGWEVRIQRLKRRSIVPCGSIQRACHRCTRCTARACEPARMSGAPRTPKPYGSMHCETKERRALRPHPTSAVSMQSGSARCLWHRAWH